jgi:hypothetical protein
MATCPNKNLESWKLLLASRGEDIAYYLWDKYDGNVPESESKESIVKSGLKATNILQSPKADQFFASVAKNKISGDFFWKKMQVDLGIPKDQIEILKSFNTEDKGTLISSLLGNYSYTVEINTAKSGFEKIIGENEGYAFIYQGIEYNAFFNPGGDVEYEKDGEQISEREYLKDKKEGEKQGNMIPTQIYSSLTVPGGTNYTENEIATPAITPSIKGHARFATDQGIGWFRSDDKASNKEYSVQDFNDMYKYERSLGYPNATSTTTRRILEIQSDLFQKGRDEKYLIGNMEYTVDELGPHTPKDMITSNSFLQLLNKDNNWVTFFLKSILQDSAKKGYEKVLFPSGNTASKVEGHTTLEEFKKQKEDRIKQLEDSNNTETFYNEQGEVYEEPDFLKKERIENNNREIAQLKQELERVEGPEGFGALKPIYNFYEITVNNILKKQGYSPKQVKDEFGNTWNEVTISPEREQQPILLQKKGTEGSVASPATIKLLKDFLNRIGVDIKTVDEIVIDGVKQNANGAAVFTQQLVQIVNGKEDVALGEETMHWAVEIIKQKYPKLFAKMLKEINDYAIYKQVLADYSTDPNYQTADGKPDILKLKTEAIGKVLSETVIKNNEGITQRPELLQKALTWWQSMIESLRSLFTTSGFDEASMKIISGEEIGTVEDVRSEDVLYQKAELTGKEKLDAFFDKYMGIAKRMRLVDTDPEDRHYTIDGRRIKNSVTKWIKRLESNKFVRTDAQKIVDNQKQYWGSDVHSYFEQMAKNSFLDKDGYRKAVPTPYNATTNLSPEVTEILDGFLAKVIASYPEGTRFISEEFLLNEKEDIASTLDFMAFVPDGNSFYVEVLDWKTITIDLEQTEDVPWFKQGEYKKQMGEYVKILQRYGIKPAQIRKARMIPIKANYENMIPEDYNSPLFLESVEIGDLDNPKETQLYLLPVPIDFESTGNKRLDKLIQALRNQYDKFVRRVVDPRQQYLKDTQRQELAIAIRKLHLQMDFGPIASIGNTFLNNSRAVLDRIKYKDFSTMSFEEMQEVLKELNYVTEGANKYQEIAEVFIYVNKDKKLSEEEKQVLSDLERLASRTETLLTNALSVKQLYVAQLSVNYGITRENPVESVRRAAAGEMIQEGSILNPERELSGAAKLLQEGADMASRAVNLMQRIWDLGKNDVDRQVGLQIRAFGKVLEAAQKEATAKGVDVFDLVATKVKGGVPRYIEKLSDKFQEKINDARDSRDKNFFLNVIDKAKYDKLAKEVLDNGIIAIDSNPNIDDEEKARKTDRLKDKILLDRESFNGFYDGIFYKIFYQSIDTDKNSSEEYKAMSPAALDLWKFIVEGLNAKAQDLGYIGKADSSFLALIDALTIDKFTDLKNIGGNLGDFFKDTYTVRMAEERALGKIDRETGKEQREIPKYFTITDRKANQLSTDLTKIVPLWIKAINEYELRSQMDDVLLTIIAVEKNKGNLMVDKDNELLNDMGEPMVTAENKNIEQLETMYNAYILGVNENENSFSNKYIKLAFDKTGGLAEDKERRKLGTKKVLKTLTTWTQMLGTGLKLSVGIPNWFGNQFQAFINSGNFYRFREFEKNNARVMIPGLIKPKVLGLVDLVMPLNEDVATEERRKIAFKQSPIKWLKTFTFQDVMMITSSLPEKRLQIAHALSFNENTMVLDGQLVNIRQYLTQQDRASKYQMTESERTALEKTFEARVQELKDTKSLIQIADDSGEYVTIPGVSNFELAKYRITIRDNFRDMSGQMSQEDKAGYTRDTMASAFMMFKGWIPKQISLRTKDIKYNVKQNRWEYGRTRLFGKLLVKHGLSAFKKSIAIMNGTDEGLKMMQEILNVKRNEYFERTGEELQISNEEFYDLMRKAVRDQFKEMQIILLTLALYFGTKHFGDDDDEEDEGTKNKWKYLSKIMYKTAEEVNFYYNPLSVEGFTNGNLIPGMTIATKAMKIITTGTKEMYGTAVGDQELLDKNYFGKAVFDIAPGPSQFQKEILPLYFPELAKEWGIRVPSETQRR